MMSKTERMILLVRCVFQERYFSGNAIAKNLSIVAEHKIKPVEKNPTPATYGEILHEILFNESHIRKIYSFLPIFIRGC